MNVGNMKGTRMSPNSLSDKFGLSPSGRDDLSCSVLKLLIAGFKSIKNIVHMGPRVMLTFMPPLGTLLQCLIITFFVLFDETFEAAVVAGMVFGLEENNRKVIILLCLSPLPLNDLDHAAR